MDVTRWMSAAPLVLVCAGAGPALAQSFYDGLVFTGANGATTTIYGQINLTYQGVDDGTDRYDRFVDNSNSTSRLGLRVDVPMGDRKFMFNAEVGLGLTNTAETFQDDDLGWIDWQRTDIRKFEGAYTVPGFGTVWIGQGSMATDGAAEIDKSGTSVVGYASLADTAGSYLFRSGGMLSGVDVGDAFKDFDGARRMRIRYDTPEYYGFTFSAAYGQDVLSEDNDTDYYDIALRYGYDVADFQLDAAVGYGWASDDGDTDETLMASTSMLHKPTGISVTLSTGGDQTGQANFVYSKVGWTGRPFAIGDTSVSVDYYTGEDFVSAGSSSESWGLQAVQHIEDLHLETYLGYRVLSFDEPGTDYADLDVLLFGARWKF